MHRQRKPGPTALAATGIALSLVAAPEASGAQTERRLLGVALTLGNDDYAPGEVQDRWRTGALSARLLHGTGWPRAGRVGLGEVLEFGIRAEILSPEDVDNPAPGDRPYAGLVALGVHTHARRAGTEYRIGADLVVTGPQTGLSDLQENLHDAFDLPDPSAAAENQIGDAAYLAVSGEVARPVPLGASVTLRPFAAARLGDETYARIGADLVGGSLASGGLLVRDYGTGQLVEGTRGRMTGFGWSIGADLASVADSVYLPGDAGRPGPNDTRSRVRGGAMWAGERWSAFAGAAWLGEEFEGQDEGQVVGSVSLTYGF
jgi:hypothetical protein